MVLDYNLSILFNHSYSLPSIMKKAALCFLIFVVVACIALFAMKTILWAMFEWGSSQALAFALVFTSLYVGCFFAVKKNRLRQAQSISDATLKIIWVLGFVQLAVLGILYHLLPQYFPAIIADFFFA